MSQFQFNLSLSKAFEKDGRKYIAADVSDTRLDYHDHHMTEKALDDMEGMLKNGFSDLDGKLQKVYLLPEHGSTFEIGYADDGKIIKDKDGHHKLTATFELIKDNPTAEQLYSEVAAGTCKKQLSVGGDAVGHAYFDEEAQKTIGSLDSITRLEHVACTRPGKAAVKSTGFIGSMLKSIESDVANEMEFAKKAMTDAERKKSAVLVWDNSRTHDMYMEGDKAYLHPIPDGDKMAAKVAMSNALSSKYPYTRAERKAVHDAAKDVLGDEHKNDSPYCYLCSGNYSVYDSVDGAPIKVAQTINKMRLEKTGEGDTDMEVEKEIGELKAQMSEALALIKALKPVEAAKTAEEIAKERAASAPITAGELDKILEKSNSALLEKLNQPMPRTNAEVPNGAAAVVKDANGGQQAADNVAAGDAEMTEVQKAIAEKDKRLSELEVQRGDIIAKRKGGLPFTSLENLTAQNIEKEYGQIRAAITHMKTTGNLVK